VGRALTSVALIPEGSLDNRGVPPLRNRWCRTKKNVVNTAETARMEINDTAIIDHAVFSKAGCIVQVVSRSPTTPKSNSPDSQETKTA